MATTTTEENRNIPADSPRCEILSRIPADLLRDEILSRIPATDLFRIFRLVSRQWRRLISSPEFIQIHLKRSIADETQIRIIIADPTAMTYYNYAPGATKDPRFYPYPPSSSHRHESCPIILGSCDGLICLYEGGNQRFSVFNPSMNRYELRLADKFRWLFLTNYASWFGRNPCTGEYVLVIGSRLQGSHVDIRVYELKTHAARKSRSIIHQKKHGRDYKYFDPVGKFLHGALHWAACTQPMNEPHFEKKHVIVAYDFGKNEILEIPAPREFQFTVGVVDECLFVIFKNAAQVFELWTMREYGVKESWTKYANIEGDVEVFKYTQLLVPLAFSSDHDELIVDADRKKVVKYSFKEKKITVLKNHDSRESIAISYVDSLVPAKVIFE
ncbi:hypothetical protein ABFS83_14G037400 [Erythranthe nasuta]